MTVGGWREQSRVLVGSAAGTDGWVDDGPSDHSDDHDASPTLTLPKAPESIEATGLSPSFLLELLIKIIHYAEAATPTHLARVIGLPRHQVDDLLETLKASRLCEVMSSSDGISSASRYRLSDAGAVRAEQALKRCRYASTAPVTLEQYEQVIGGQSLHRWRPSVEAYGRPSNP